MLSGHAKEKTRLICLLPITQFSFLRIARLCVSACHFIAYGDLCDVLARFALAAHAFLIPSAIGFADTGTASAD